MRDWLILTVASLCLATQARADLIKYQITATASGTLGPSSFTNSLVTLTLFGDSSTIAAGPAPLNNVRLDPGTATVNVSGLGSATLTGSVEIISTFNDVSLIGLLGSSAVFIAQLDNPAGTSVTGILGQIGDVYLGYDLHAPFGPIVGTGGAFSGSKNTPHFSTSVGDLTWAVGQPLHEGSTFSATTVTPEPGTLIPMVLMGLFLGRKRIAQALRG